MKKVRSVEKPLESLKTTPLTEFLLGLRESTVLPSNRKGFRKNTSSCEVNWSDSPTPSPWRGWFHHAQNPSAHRPPSPPKHAQLSSEIPPGPSDTFDLTLVRYPPKLSAQKNNASTVGWNGPRRSSKVSKSSLCRCSHGRLRGSARARDFFSQRTVHMAGPHDPRFGRTHRLGVASGVMNP